MMFSRLSLSIVVAALCAVSGVTAGASNTAGCRNSGLIIATPLRIVPALLSMALVQQTMAAPIPQEEEGSTPAAVTTEEITTTFITTAESPEQTPITTTTTTTAPTTTSTTVAGALAVSTRSSIGAVAQGICGWGIFCNKGW